jgi:hypothetical protein
MADVTRVLATVALEWDDEHDEHDDAQRSARKELARVLRELAAAVDPD